MAFEEAHEARELSIEDRRAAQVLIRHLFAPAHHRIDRLDYSVAYRLSEGAVGGDIVDVYHFDNGNVSLAVADISGKGATAAIHAALVKYGLRCFSSEGLTPERLLRSLDRVYIENNAFERTESFASVFFAIVDDTRRALTYASAGHEPVLLVQPGEDPVVLEPTAPLIGVFDDQHHLFRQRLIEVNHGAMIVAATDGVTEARSPDGEFYGMKRMIACVKAAAPAGTHAVVGSIIAEIEAFTVSHMRDDVAILAAALLPDDEVAA